MSDEQQMHPLFTWRAAICESGLSPVTRHVALTLALYMNERGGSAYPGPTRIANDTGLHVSTVKERLTELERFGWLECVERGGRVGERKRANAWEARIPPTPLPMGQFDPSPVATRRRGLPVAVGYPSPLAQPPVATGDPISSLNSPSRDGRRKQRGTPCPDPFTLDPEDYNWAEEHTPSVDVRMATMQFVTYWRGTGGLKVRWKQAWRNWLLKDEANSKSGRQASRTFL